MCGDGGAGGGEIYGVGGYAIAAAQSLAKVEIVSWSTMRGRTSRTG